MAPTEGSSEVTERETASYVRGTYTLRSLVEDVPLSADGEASDIWITCVELWEGNLYIGTSAAEILHFVSLPPDPREPTARPSFILASRLQPTYTQPASASQALHGIQQILLLPTANKACILCNGTLTFYSLPELSPAFGGTTKVSNCSWVGGVDLNVEEVGPGGEVVMVAIKNRIRLVKIGEEPRLVKNIEYPGCLSSMRRNAIACVADTHSYALLDVEQQRKIPLFPISSLDEGGTAVSAGQVEDISRTGLGMSRSVSSRRVVPNDDFEDSRGHGRSTSLGTFVSGLGRRRPSPRPQDMERAGIDIHEPVERAVSPLPASSPERAELRAQSPDVRTASPDKPKPPDAQDISNQSMLAQTAKPKTAVLQPHILSPSPTEFLLITGTSSSEPGVGIFVNLEGDVVRGSLEFSKYPEAVVIDGKGVGVESQVEKMGQAQDGYVLAIVRRDGSSGTRTAIEIQRWDVAPGAGGGSEWLGIPPSITKDNDTERALEESELKVGIRATATASAIHLPEVGDKLRLVRLRLPKLLPVTESTSLNKPSSTSKDALTKSATKDMDLPQAQQSGQGPSVSSFEASRLREEESFAQRIGELQSQTIIWSGNRIWWLVRNPLLLRLDAVIGAATLESITGDGNAPLDRRKLIDVIRSIRGKEAGTELQFLTLNYVRQKASLLLLADALNALHSKTPISAAEKRATEEVLLEGTVDPRVVLAMLYPLREEIFEGREGIWIHRGLLEIAKQSLALQTTFEELEADSSSIGNNFLSLVKRYLMVWRRKKGFGSISNEQEVFQTVDAALLHVMLQLDSHSPRGPAPAASVRAELNAVVDHGLDCFDRAVILLEKYWRLYLLSRLYQSRKMASKVLSTWRRILEGEPDDGGEFVDGENEMRKYLIKIRDGQLVEEYGAWLARRNPKLGVQVFADDGSRVKFEPAQVVQLLRRESPEAVKEYLEHLVFGKHVWLSFYLGQKSELTSCRTYNMRTT